MAIVDPNDPDTPLRGRSPTPSPGFPKPAPAVVPSQTHRVQPVAAQELTQASRPQPAQTPLASRVGGATVAHPTATLMAISSLRLHSVTTAAHEIALSAGLFSRVHHPFIEIPPGSPPPDISGESEQSGDKARKKKVRGPFHPIDPNRPEVFKRYKKAIRALEKETHEDENSVAALLLQASEGGSPFEAHSGSVKLWGYYYRIPFTSPIKVIVLYVVQGTFDFWSALYGKKGDPRIESAGGYAHTWGVNNPGY
jgi:hypothetical protein